MTPFERFYGSFAQQPLLLWAAVIVGLAIVLLRRSTARSVRVFCVWVAAVAALDTWLTADQVAGVGSLGALTVTVATLFAIVDDTRVFLFLEGATPEGQIAIDRRGAVRAIAWSLVVPILAAVARPFIPEGPSRGRETFLFYEVAFLGVLAVRYLVGLRASRGTQRWTRPVIAFVAVYYALWALADVLILVVRLDAGYLVRVLANVLYYGGLHAAVSLAAPAHRGETKPRKS